MSTRTFRAAVVREPSGPDSIEIVDVPAQELGPGVVRVAVAGAAVNPVDIGVSSGTFHRLGLVDQPRWTGLGWDFAGTVVSTGPGVTLPVGARVAGMIAGFDRDFGTYAEELLVRADEVAVVPAALESVRAATVPLNALAASALVDLAGPAVGGSRLLVTGAAGAVGGNALALAADAGWQVTGLARASDEEFVHAWGADFTTDPGAGWDVVLDAAAMLGPAVALVRDGGVYVGTQPSAVPAPERGIDIRVIEARLDVDRLRGLLQRAAEGRLPIRVHEVMPLESAAQAQRAMARGGLRGRIVLTPTPA